MDSKQIRFVIGVFAFVLLVCLISPLLMSTREPVLPLSRAPLAFDAAHAYRAAQEFVTRFPRRVLGSLESRQSTGYLRDSLEKQGYAIEYSHFDARIDRHLQVGRNVLAYKRGQSSEILALIAHFDTARTTVQGAMESGGAVGVLLELARIFAAKPTHRSLLFVFSDGEEWGMLGAQDLARSYPERHRIVAVLSLDNVGIGDLAGFCLEETGQLEGFAPPWLRQLAQRAAEEQEIPVTAPSGIREHLERTLCISWADQGPFLSAGIPAINLGSESADPVRERAVYHSPQDIMDNLTVASIEKFGLAAERIALTLDDLPSIPRESSGYFKLWDGLFLGPNTIMALHAVAFLPLLFIFFFHLRNHRTLLSLIPVGRELLAYSGTILPLLAVYFLIRLVRALRLLPLYALYPATPKDPVLENPPWGLLGGIFGAALILAIICYLIGRFSFRNLPKPGFYVSKLILLGLTLIVVVFALAYNSYWASTFLILPAWIWALVGCNSIFGRRIGNWIWILAAGSPYFILLWIYASRLEMRWNFIWYQVLALSTGMFSAAGYLLATAAIAIGIRFFVIQTHGRVT